MPRKNLNLEKRQLRLHKGDVEIIQNKFPHIPYNAIMREIIHAFAKSIEQGGSGVIQYDPNSLKVESND